MRKFLPTHYELISKFRTLRKTATPATRHNSRFAGSISRLAGIFAGKTQKNNSDAPTSGNHNFSIRTPIRANFISLEIRLLKISNSTLHDPFSAPEGLQKLPRKPDKKTVWTRKSRRICWRCHVIDKIAMWKHMPRSLTMRCAKPPYARSLYKSYPPPLIPTSLARVPRQKLGLE